MLDEADDFLDTYHPGQAARKPTLPVRARYDDDTLTRGYPAIANSRGSILPSDTAHIAPSVANSRIQEPLRTSVSGRSIDSVYPDGRQHKAQKSSHPRSSKSAKSKRSQKAQSASSKKSSSAKKDDKYNTKPASKSRSFIQDRIRRVRISLVNSGLVSARMFDKDLQAFLPKDRMTGQEFERHVKLMRRYQIIATSEYKSACKYETYSCRHATKESNLVKNSYKKCIPYDYNRVVLKTLPNVPDSDYVNASHIDSYLKPNAYIAAQGPNEFTIDDFWRMIWEQKSFVVVMLTKVFDFIRVMCNQYWPVELNKREKYGQLEVTLLYEEPLADFVIRTIRLCKAQTDKTDETNSNAQNVILSDNENEGNENNAGNNDSDDSRGDLDYNDMELTDEADRPLGSSPVSQPVTPSLETQSRGVSPFRQPKYVEGSSVNRPVRRTNLRSPNNKPILKIAHTDAEGKILENVETPTGRITVDSVGTPSLTSTNLSRQSPFFRQQRLSSNMNVRDNGMDSVSQPSTPGVFLTPMTPLTPQTPGSSVTPTTPMSGLSGLERASATRKPVKKKKRERKRNIRPVRTQFQAPDEAALNDDDSNPEASGGNQGVDGSGGGPSERIIYQFHYHSWPSHTCPSIGSLLHFRRRVRICMEEMSKSGKTGPTIVHCNDGCGRTGTYLCIDANLELSEEDGVYDVFNYTMKMRQSRKFLIENIRQYKFVYDTIEEAMLCGKTWFPVSELSQRLKHKSTRNPITKKNEYQREYEKITTRMRNKFSIGDCAGGHRVDNREKNRDVSTVPPDNFRPYLTSFQSNDNTDYINAVFVDGYTRSKEYIVTEWPMQHTISDFWSLIYDHDCNSVILLANPIDSKTYPSFLLGEKERQRKFGSVFTADKVQSNEYQNIKSWIYTINKKIMALSEVMAGMKPEPKTTQIFQITCWPQGHRVPTSTNTLVELMNMVERWRQRTAYGPVCVVSLDGKSRAGVYCAANVAIEQVVQHGEVDVFQAVKTVRRHRPQLIENMTEYKYCYDLILHYVLHYLNQNTK